MKLIYSGVSVDRDVDDPDFWMSDAAYEDLKKGGRAAVTSESDRGVWDLVERRRHREGYVGNFLAGTTYNEANAALWVAGCSLRGRSGALAHERKRRLPKAPFHFQRSIRPPSYISLSAEMTSGCDK